MKGFGVEAVLSSKRVCVVCVWFCVLILGDGGKGRDWV